MFGSFRLGGLFSPLRPLPAMLPPGRTLLFTLSAAVGCTGRSPRAGELRLRPLMLGLYSPRPEVDEAGPAGKGLSSWLRAR
jgi:hypothetical protein